MKKLCFFFVSIILLFIISIWLIRDLINFSRMIEIYRTIAHSVNETCAKLSFDFVVSKLVQKLIMHRWFNDKLDNNSSLFLLLLLSLTLSFFNFRYDLIPRDFIFRKIKLIPKFLWSFNFLASINSFFNLQ